MAKDKAKKFITPLTSIVNINTGETNFAKCLFVPKQR